ncbi:MAG: MotA/TolQ/ExbB proton channel family protein [Deltaproteobacteria bacterium]|nr:MotA/TolQ/ExbB proton channel family protein [Deltaproteobacteria bacterium]
MRSLRMTRLWSRGLVLACAFGFASGFASPASAQDAVNAPETEPSQREQPKPPEPKSLDELLEMVQQGFIAESAENEQRETRFLAANEDQQRLLDEALALLAREEEISQALENTYNENEPLIGTLESQLTERLGEMCELFGVVRQISNDLGGQIWESLTSAQLGPRKELLDRLGRSKELPTTQDLESLWFEMQREITAQGKVERFTATIVTIGGGEAEREVIRAGPFSAISNGGYLLWDPFEQQLTELPRQPPSKYLDTVDGFENATSGYAKLAVDPSKGALLNALLDTTSPRERVDQGGYVGYVIISLGIGALLIGVWRWLLISAASRGVKQQQKADRPSSDNPLGRILAISRSEATLDSEALELRLDEAVLKETSDLERYLWLVKTVSVVAPLLGLLGTVTGMIKTFQAITLFGAGDPKMMAGGISEALVTTMLGLITAIPLVLLYDTLSNSASRIIDILDHQSAGLIAARVEGIDVGD